MKKSIFLEQANIVIPIVDEHSLEKISSTKKLDQCNVIIEGDGAHFLMLFVYALRLIGCKSVCFDDYAITRLPPSALAL